MSKHTPGPWRVDREGFEVVHIDSGLTVVGEIIGIKYVPALDDYRNDDEESAIANTRLIAAAPQLLESLEDVLSFAAYTEDPGDPQVLCKRCWEEKPKHTPKCLIAKAEAAIRKAKEE